MWERNIDEKREKRATTMEEKREKKETLVGLLEKVREGKSFCIVDFGGFK